MHYNKLKKIGYELSDINIIQSKKSFINHRFEDCSPFISICNRNSYPVIVAPMSSVTDGENVEKWLSHNFIAVVPRSVDLATRDSLSKVTFSSYSLNEAINHVQNWELNEEDTRYICIDIAHGTMAKLYEACGNLKKKFGGKIVIMTGNVANPSAYSYYANIGIDYMRASIGSGSRCTTACNVGVHYPMASLINELNIERQNWEDIHEQKSPTKIIADGGLTNFDDIQKCLALGADAVMNGSWFAKSEEACGKIYYDTFLGRFKDTDNKILRLFYKLIGGKRKRDYYGMSTKQAQRENGNDQLKTSEGVSRPVNVEYSINKWRENMHHFLVSAMSYTNSRTIEDLKNNTDVIINASGDGAFRK